MVGIQPHDITDHDSNVHGLGILAIEIREKGQVLCTGNVYLK